MKQVLANPRLYALWQMPFVRQKLAPFLAANDPDRVGRVLDVGCGPGTNAAIFAATAYLGIDLDPSYVAEATARHGPRFRQGDAGALEVDDFGPVDCLFTNSLTHHLDDTTFKRLLARTDLVTPEGRLHLIDMYLPARGIGRRLALADRGKFPRPLERIRALVAATWEIELEQSFALQALGVGLWQMVYFRARTRLR